MSNKIRAEIIAGGLVQGVGFRYYIMSNAQELGLNGYAKNLYTGEVITVVEGERGLIEELFKRIKTGPSHSSVSKVKIVWSDNKDEFTHFNIRF
ncbi:MAG: acylphosphatase [Ignavibacteriaceae bacterium]